MASYHIFDCESYPEPYLLKVNKIAPKDEIRIYPNPSSDGFSLTNMPPNWKLQVNNILGMTVYEKNGSGNTSIPAGLLSKGIYTTIINNLITLERTTKKILVY
jgi:Secretion system C-terminal sorting domain